MTTVTQIVTQLRTILSALPDVDEHSQDNYEPAIKTAKVALLIVPFEQRGSMSYARVGGSIGTYSISHSHRITCEFWIKVNTGNIAASMQRGRDICLDAMQLLAANPELNGTVMKLGAVGADTMAEYDVMGHIDRSQVPYILAKLYVHVTLNEPAQW